MFDAQVDGGPVGDGAWLVDRRHDMEVGEVGWLDRLAAFDAARGWEADGQFSCATWLQWRCQMCRSTAFEKVRVAHALTRRPLVHDAYAGGAISYSAARVILGLDHPSVAVDEALIALAQVGTVADVERAVRHQDLLYDQDNPKDPYRRFDRRGFRVRRGMNGMGSIEIVLELTEIDEAEVILQAFIDRHPGEADQSAGADFCLARTDPTDTAEAEDAEQSAGADSQRPGTGFHIVDVNPWWVRRADAFLAMCRTALDHAHDGQAAGADRYLVHLIRSITPDSEPRFESIDGTPISAAVMDRVCCDASFVTHHVGDGGEPLNLGRKTREWSTAQRRAITVRDGGRCRFPGCTNRHGDLHHVRWWNRHGTTDINNGAFLCARHHTLVHGGFEITGDANHTLTFHRPNHAGIIGTTTPAGQLC